MNLARGCAFVPAGRVHMAYVLDSFRRSLTDLGAVPAGLVQGHVAGLERQLRGGIGRAVVATPIGHPDTFLGWMATDGGSVVFAYTGLWYRHEGVARTMWAHLFREGPLRLVYWTETAEEIREHGFPLVHDWREFARRERAAERATRQRFEERAHG